MANRPQPRYSMMTALGLAALAAAESPAQPPPAEPGPTRPTIGEAVPFDVRQLYDRGARYLANTQSELGDWKGKYRGPGTTGMGVMVFLATGEDPNFGSYSENTRRALRRLISQQDAATGFLGENMYHHGFGMLALAEAYGAVDDRRLWRDAVDAPGQRSVGAALELAVRCAVTSQQKNPFGAWRYGPDDDSADTSASGAVLMGLLGARNAGIEVPDESINRAIDFYAKMTSDEGMVAYSTGFAAAVTDSVARTAITALVLSIAGRDELPACRAALDRLKRAAASDNDDYYLQYADYYRAQALFQGDIDAWRQWNKTLVNRLKGAQRPDGGFASKLGPETGTPLSLLALAVNYRLLPIYER